MPVSRSTRRRRSSLGLALSAPIKPGTYGISVSPRGVTFAPNVTPGTFIEEAEGNEDLTAEPTSPTDALFPPSEVSAPAASRRRAPPGKRRSQGYIPRPPNAFMLFRANFVRQKHVPGSIETNHGSLSKIIGTCWKSLPETEKKVWELKAKKAKAEHREMYPNYRFRPVHNKNKLKRKEKLPVEAAEEKRCEEVAQLLLEGKKGEELAAAVRRLDLNRTREMTGSQSPMPPLQAPLPTMATPMPFYAHRRSSSVPPPTMHYPIAIPSMNFFQPSHPYMSRPQTPMGELSYASRMMLGSRRASSAGPSYYDAWTHAAFSPNDLQRDTEPLPEVAMGLFDPSYAPQDASLNYPPFGTPGLAVNIGPLDNMSHDQMADAFSPASSSIYSVATPADALHGWMHGQYDGPTPSGSPSAYSTPPPELDSPPQYNLEGYGQHADHAAVFENWHGPLVVGSDPVMENLHETFNQQMNGLGYSVQEYSCAPDQQLFNDPTTCNMEHQQYTLSDELSLSAELSQC